MACCYIAASMIAFIINSCDALNININLQYNESLDPSKGGNEDDNDDPFPVPQQNGPTIISVGGMTCTACTGNVERALLSVEGVERVLVSLPLQEAKVVHDADVSKASMVSAIEDVGYDANIGQRPPEQRIETLQQSRELTMLSQAIYGISWLSTILFALDKGVGWLVGKRRFQNIITPSVNQGLIWFVAASIVYYFGWYIHKSALRAARYFTVNMHSLISVSTTLGLALSAWNLAIEGPKTAFTYFHEVAGLVMIVTAGRYLDMLSRRRSTNTFVGLYSILQQTAMVKVAGQKTSIPASMLSPMDRISIDPYTLIPCDSYVVSGTSHVNESLVTGESVPKSKSTGDFLIAGTRNGFGYLEAIVNQDDDGSFLSQLVQSVEDASASKATVQERVDRITRYFVSSVFGIALAVSCAVFMTAGIDLPFALRLNLAAQRMMAILAAACPCALGLATPCAIMAGIDVSWRKGILMTEGAKAMEALKSITHVVMDKTGTLTQGKLKLSSMSTSKIWQDDVKGLCVLICAAEEHGASAHPIGMTIFKETLRLASDKWQQYKSHGAVKNLEEIAGQGVKCDIHAGDSQWRSVLVGSLRLLKESNVKIDEGLPIEIDALGTVSFVAVDGVLAASMMLEDSLRPDAKEAIDGLRARGLRITMLTGDNAEEASRIASQLDVQVLDASVDPIKKLDHIKALQAKGEKVAMVGDGINDGPSLAAADVGIMIAHGTRCLSAGGNVLVLSSKLQPLLTLFIIAENAMKQVRANILWALAYNSIAISLATGVGIPIGIDITPTVAAAMMSFSSVAIMYQGLRLRDRLLRLI